MGKRGPQPKPTALKLLEGTRKSRINDAEPIPPATGIPEPPEWLGELGMETWRKLAPGLHARGVLTEWDLDAFAVLCQAVASHRQASELLNRSSVLIQGDRGLVKNPALQIARDSAQVIRAFAQEFGLTPSARSGLRVEEVTDDSELRRLLS